MPPRAQQDVQRETHIDNMRSWCQTDEAAGRLAWPMGRLYRTGNKTDWKKIMTKEHVNLVARLCREHFGENIMRKMFSREEKEEEEGEEEEEV